MRKSNKSDLAKLLTKRAISLENLPDQIKYVIDGGALLHRVRWIKNCSYGDVIGQYRNYLQTKFGQCVVVFDGYKMSTKDHEHKRRKSNVTAPYVKIEFNNHINQHSFLSNESN